MENPSRNKSGHANRSGADRVPSRATWPPAWLAEPVQPEDLPLVTAETTSPAYAPADDPQPTHAPLPMPLQVPSCRRCGSTRFVDVVLTYPPHDGRTVRRDCAKCGRFWDFVLWYGQQNEAEHRS